MKFEFVASSVKPAVPESHRTVTVTPEDLPLFCPTRADNRWNMHPRVFIPLGQSDTTEALCPYCGTLYKLVQNA